MPLITMLYSNWFLTGHGVASSSFKTIKYLENQTQTQQTGIL